MRIKIFLTIIGSVALALAVTVLLNYARFERTLLTVAESRFAVVVQDLRLSIETGLDLGLELRLATGAPSWKAPGWPP
jgi:hypothetical protein